jgi:alkylated DNA repair dioxygenase AlkB
MDAIPFSASDFHDEPRWLPGTEADALFGALRERIPWERHRIRLFGREIEAPRLSCWIGDPDAAYTYSRVRYDPHPWPDALCDVRERLRAACGVAFNGVLANLYRDGGDSMGWHSDDEPELDPVAPIASLSLGAMRRFAVRHRGDRAKSFAIELGHGSLLRMSRAMQRDWQHALPRTARAVGPRINLTFRRIARM